MLDPEPDTTNPPGAADPATAPTADVSTTSVVAENAPAQRPRRRAASRPAGPPTATAAAPPPVEPVAPVALEPVALPPVAEPVVEPAPAEPPVESSEPAKRPARKTAAKRPAKKEVVATDGEEPKARAPRKRAVKKTAAPAAEASVDELLAPAELTESVPAEAAWPDPEPEPAEAASSTIDQRLAELAARVAAEPDVESPEVETPEVETPVLAEDPDAVLPLDETEVPAPADEQPLETDPEASAEDDADETEVAEDQDTSDEDGQDDGNRRRRRRRGGRRRRRTGSDADDNDPDATDSDATDSGRTDTAGTDTDSPGSGSAGDDDSEGAGDTEADGDSDSETQRRRRRRRRRRGEDAGSSPDDPTEVVVRVREPRRSGKSGEGKSGDGKAGGEGKASNEVTGIEGSTRMEAKRQRRRDGRDAGRRRPPILSEAEFLARREAVSRKMIIRQRADLSQIAVLEDDILVEHYVDRDSAASLIGNVYLGRVQNVLPSMEAAFIDIGRGRNAVLYAGEVDWDSFGAEGHARKVEKVLKSGQSILVQVSKDPVGAKGARLTNNVSIPGRYIVYSPSGHLSGISRKLPDIERKRLRDILADLVGETASVIVRTAAEGASEDELVRDVNRLKAQWADIERRVASGSAPQLLYGEPDLTVRIVRDLFTEDFAELIIAGNGQANDAYDAVEGYVTHVAPHLQERIRRWEGEADDRDVFADYRLDEQIAKALERKVFLPSGGSLVIDRTEAMTVIDVNTGKFTGTGGNLEATVTSNNLEAAEEIVRQLRLRDIGGIIVVDFIDMVLPANRELLLRRLVECLSRDRTRHQVAEVTSLGLVQMTRKKLGTGLLEAFTTECPHCLGRGMEIHDVPVESQKQADGGTRESRPRDQRRGGGSAAPKPTDPHANGHPVEPAGPGSDTDGDAEERSGSGRSRRGGGRSRRGSGREQAAPAEDDGAPTPSADHEPQPELVQG